MDSTHETQGRGAKLDGAIANANTLETSVLFNECTFIVPTLLVYY